MRLPRPSISLPRPRLSLRTGLALLAIVLAGGAAWYFLVRDNGPTGDAAGPHKGGDTRGPKEDPNVRSLSTAERVDQVLMLGFDGTGPDIPIVGELAKHSLGAVLVRGENWTGASGGKSLITVLKGPPGQADPPLIVASQEGGQYRSYPDLPPDARALDIGRQGDTDAAEAWAKAGAGALKAVGFDLNLFPVADVATLDSPLAGRAFSDDENQVAALAKAALAGCDDAALACAPLHFPGLGAASQDTADGPATINLDPGTLEARDLLPFAATLKTAPAVVVSLGLYSAYDPITPAALSPDVATGLLRDQLGFKGVAISDDLSAGAIRATSSAPDAAVDALRAGIDLIQVSDPADQAEVAGALVDAVKSGQVPSERLADAAARVIELKRKLGLVD